VVLRSLLTPPFDLHALGTPPAFILSQDQTLRLILFRNSSNSFFFYSKAVAAYTLTTTRRRFRTFFPTL
jgi:hypothetical protein